MYLTEDTPEAQEMRDNVLRLLTSGYEPNIRLAFSLVEGGGLHLSFFFPLWAGCFTDRETVGEKKAIWERVIWQYVGEDVLTYLQIHFAQKEKYWWNDMYDAFKSNYFFELMVAYGLFSVGELTRLWYEDTFYYQNTNLTYYLLEQNVPLGKNLFQSRFFPPIYAREHTYKLLQKIDFWDALVKHGLFSVGELVDLWHKDAVYHRETVLTRFFFERILLPETDKRFLFHEHIAPNSHLLHCQAIAQLFETEDATFDKKAFLQTKYLQNGTLDLNNTCLKSLPAEALELEGVHTLNIIGTKIETLPTELLLRIKNIKATRKMHRRIHAQMKALGRQDYFYAQYRAIDRGLSHFRRKKYIKAIDAFRVGEPVGIDSFLSVEERGKYWQAYFASFVRVGKLDEALQVLEKATSALPYPVVFHWRWMDEYMRVFMLAEREGEVLALFEPYAKSTAATHNVWNMLGMNGDYFWRLQNEKLAYQCQIKESFTFFENAKQYATLHPTEWRWLKIFRHLRDLKKYAEIIELFEYHETTVFYRNNLPAQRIDRHERCVWIWIEAHIAVGKLDKAEMLCSYYLRNLEETKRNTSHRYMIAKASEWAKLAYSYLAEIYTLQGNTACALLYQNKL